MEETRSRENMKGLTLQASDQEGSPKAILGNPSKELEVLAINRNAIGRRLSLRIENLTIKRYDDALNILERVTNSLFYQIDLNINIPLSLARQRHYRRLENVQRSIESPEFKFPESEYDRAPIELYWYVRSASGMPLLQYLAFYQTIEFYFPAYSQAESRRKIKNILKDPSFSPNRDVDIGKVLTALRLGGGYGFGDERSQLKATLLECVNQDQLRSFLTLSEERKEFFASKTKGLTEHKLSLNNQSADLRNEVSERIYDIRCKIVHTKNNASEGEVELLLPFSIESDLLYFDIELIQFIARQVLIAASSPIRI